MYNYSILLTSEVTMSHPQQTDKLPATLTDRVRGLVRDILTPLGRWLHHIGVHPDMVTIFGLMLVIIAAVLIAMGYLRSAGLLLLFALPLDAVDGAVARAMQRKDKFGAVLDSTFDRYADGFIFAGLSYYFAVQGYFELFLLAQLALIGSLLVSYVRARADGVQVETKIGWFTRMERVGVILIMLLAPFLLQWGVLVLAIGTNFTALQRLWFVYNTLKNRGN
jgi:CDP-diacylglycerol--glycerol-3-phosphate 3-phosphatidyltransferase